MTLTNLTKKNEKPMDAYYLCRVAVVLLLTKMPIAEVEISSCGL